MSEVRLASIIINNYNYGRFLDEAIRSACEQTYQPTEVIVVDDGSIDDSRAVIARYAGSVVPVLKENGGQASALNAGFAASRGEVVVFLDADDTLLPDALSSTVPLLADSAVAKVHWPLQVIDVAGRPTGRLVPKGLLPDGDFRELVRRAGSACVNSPPTTGNAWSRWFLERVLPIPEQEHRISADAYLFGLAPALGLVRRSDRSLGCYRVHGTNYYCGKSFEEHLDVGCRVEQEQWRVLRQYQEARGVITDPACWQAHSWFHQLRTALEEIRSCVPPNSSLILIDEDRWAASELGRGCRCVPFPEREGEYAGRPPDDRQAVIELQRLCRKGAEFAVVTWSAFWWLDHYPGLGDYLSTFRRPVATERVMVFDLRNGHDVELPT